MRILHVFDHSVPIHSGYSFRSLAILREQRKLGWRTHHVTSPKHYLGTAPIDEAEGLTFHRSFIPAALNKAPLLREAAIIHRLKHRIGDILRTEKIDIVHAHSPSLNALAALSAAHAAGLPVVYEVRAFWEDAAVDHGTSREGGPRYRATRRLETHCLRAADAVTTICEGLRSDIIGRGIPADKVTVIPNAVDIEKFPFTSNRDDTLAQSLGVDTGTTIGFIGSFYRYEGLNLLVDACAHLRARQPGIRLLLVGGGPEEERLRQQVRAQNLEENVIFTGRVPHEDVARYYDLIDIFAYPRLSMRLTELVTPLKPLEAMARGRLVVASDVGGHRELIAHGETGMLFKAGQAENLATALDKLLAARKTWPNLKQQARHFVERERTWEVSVAHYPGVYEFARKAPKAV